MTFLMYIVASDTAEPSSQAKAAFAVKSRYIVLADRCTYDLSYSAYAGIAGVAHLVGD